MLHPSYPTFFVSTSTSNINLHFLTCGSTPYCNLLGLVCNEKGEKKSVYRVQCGSGFHISIVRDSVPPPLIRCCGWVKIVIVVLTYMASRVQTFVALIFECAFSCLS